MSSSIPQQQQQAVAPKGPVIASDDYPLATYWRNVEALVPLKPKKSDDDDDEQQQHDEDGDIVIDTMYDDHGVRLPSGPSEQVGKTENVKDLFLRECKNIEVGFSPMGIVNQDGSLFKLVFPPGEFGARIREMLVDVSFITSAATSRHAWEAQQIIGVSMILPSPVHVSPLLLALIRDGAGSARFSDAITVACRLHIVRIAVKDRDTENPEHKARCDKLRKILEAFVANEFFYRELDRIVDAGKIPLEEREEKDSRIYFDALVRQFAAACDRYALAYVHVQEWAVLDMLRVPYALRPAFMTPNMLPTASVLRSVEFGVLRSNLASYLRNRNEIFCGVYEKDRETGKERFIGIAKDSWNPMMHDLAPKLEDRLSVLARWVPNALPDADAARCMYGIHNEWIDLHTLREFMLFLSKDIRSKPAKMRPVMTETEELEASIEPGPVASVQMMMSVVVDDSDTVQDMDTAE